MSDKKKVEKVACQYCGKKYSPKGVKNHEQACSKNPENIKKEKEDREKAEMEDAAKGYKSKVKGKPLKHQVKIASMNQKKLAKYYKSEDKVVVKISPMYKPYFGKMMLVKLNGIPIYIPCDNQRYEVPASYAGEVEARIRRVDDYIQKGKRMSKVK
jgi:PHP family Zn ribbon phosphoesterase